MTDFPNDDQFSESLITKIEPASAGGWFVTRADGWSNFVDANPVEPKIGMTQRTYGNGTAFRGIFLDGAKVFYRTEDEDKEHQEIQLYGADAADWLARWDSGRGVWSIEMGGLGPGYEQAIQITAAEIVRYLIANKVDPSTQYTGDAWKALRDQIDKSLWANPKIEALGLSGAQAGAATNLATKLYMDGPRGVMNEPSIKDRHIQVSRDFPRAA